MTKCILDRILDSKQYFQFYSFLLFWSYGNFYLFIWSSCFLFIQSSGFGLMNQLSKFELLNLSYKKRVKNRELQKFCDEKLWWRGVPHSLTLIPTVFGPNYKSFNYSGHPKSDHSKSGPFWRLDSANRPVFKRMDYIG